MDTSMFEEVIRRHVKGLSLEGATRRLQGDRDALVQWLALPGNETDPLHFFYGYLLIACDSVRQMLEPPAEPGRCGEIDMRGPPNSTMERQDGGLRVTLGRLVLFIGGTQDGKLSFDEQIESFDTIARATGNQGPCRVSSVAFGPVEGSKMVGVSVIGQKVMKTVNYALKVPGGYAFGIISSPGVHEQWSESDFEQHFETIRIVQKR